MIRICLNTKYESLREFILQIPEKMESEGEMVKDGRNLIKIFIAPNGLRLNVKRYHIPQWPNKLIYSLNIRKPKGLRAYLYPAILLQAGFQTPENIAYIEERRWGLIRYSYFVSIQCDYGHELYEVGKASGDAYSNLAKALGNFTAKLHSANILHKDYSPGNILWKQDADGFHFSLVDINRMYFGPVDINLGCANFSKLWGPKRFIEVAVREYAKQRKFDEQQAITIAFQYRERFWKRYLRKHTVDFDVEF